MADVLIEREGYLASLQGLLGEALDGSRLGGWAGFTSSEQERTQRGRTELHGSFPATQCHEVSGRLDKKLEKLQKLSRNIGKAKPRKRHRIRIAVKELRLICEFFDRVVTEGTHQYVHPTREVTLA